MRIIYKNGQIHYTKYYKKYLNYKLFNKKNKYLKFASEINN